VEEVVAAGFLLFVEGGDVGVVGDGRRLPGPVVGGGVADPVVKPVAFLCDADALVSPDLGGFNDAVMRQLISPGPGMRSLIVDRIGRGQAVQDSLTVSDDASRPLSSQYDGKRCCPILGRGGVDDRIVGMQPEYQSNFGVRGAVDGRRPRSGVWGADKMG
jgi:hypothetical protein